MKDLDKRDMPNHLIILSLIFIFFFFLYYLVLKTEKYLHNIKKYSKWLNMIGNMGVLFIIIYFIVNYNVYLSLIDSHMSLDMYSFNFIYIYLFALIVTISSLKGGKYLNNLCEKYVIYTEFINIRHIKDINLICDETNESKEEVVTNINKLVEKGYLFNVKVENEHIISTKAVDKDNLVKCKSCGNVMSYRKEKMHCDFCYRKLRKKDFL